MQAKCSEKLAAQFILSAFPPETLIETLGEFGENELRDCVFGLIERTINGVL